jgi:hypothetical protein
LGQLYRIIAGVKDEDGYLAIMVPSLEHRPDLLRRHVVQIVGRLHSVGRERRAPTVMEKTDPGELLIRPARDDGLADGMPIDGDNSPVWDWFPHRI